MWVVKKFSDFFSSRSKNDDRNVLFLNGHYAEKFKVMCDFFSLFLVPFYSDQVISDSPTFL